jgi:hypothetical protein
LVVFLIFEVFRHIFEKAFGEKLKDLVLRRNPNPNKNLDLEKTVKLTADFIAYSIMIAMGLWCVNGYKGVPSVLGGQGSCRTVGDNWPLIEFNSGMRIYSFVQHGYHLQSKSIFF